MIQTLRSDLLLLDLHMNQTKMPADSNRSAGCGGTNNILLPVIRYHPSITHTSHQGKGGPGPAQKTYPAQKNCPAQKTYPAQKTCPAQGPPQEPAQKIAQDPPQKPAQKPAQEPAQEPAQKPAQKPAQMPAQEPAQDPVQKPAQEPAQGPAQEPAQDPVQKPAQEPAQGPAQDPVQKPAQEPAPGPPQEPAQKLAQDPPQKPAQKPAQEPSHKPAQEPAQKPAQEPAQDLAQKPAQKPAQEPAQDPVQKPAQEPAQGPAQEPAQEPAQGPAQKPPQGPAQELDALEQNFLNYGSGCKMGQKVGGAQNTQTTVSSLPGPGELWLEGGGVQSSIVEIEVLTRGQRENPAWFDWRRNRITASNVHRIAHSRHVSGTTPPAYLADITGQGAKVQTSAMKWGVDMESKAVKEYQVRKSKLLGREVMVQDVGLFIDPQHPWLAASPDGIVMDKLTGQRLLCLEVKCPFKHKDCTVEEACKDRHFCLQIHNLPGQGPVYQLKHNHCYYSQIQCQLAVTGIKQADLVVFTLKEVALVPVTFDPEFWERTLSKLQVFYEAVLLPHLQLDRARPSV